MMALTVRQLWASMIAEGRKHIEYRQWFTHHRGDLLICAGKKRDIDGDQPLGVALCVIELVDVMWVLNAPIRPVDLRGEPYKWGWLLRNPRPVEPQEVRGTPGLFDVDCPPLIR